MIRRDALGSCSIALREHRERGGTLSDAGVAAITRAEAAGLVLGPEIFFGMIAVRWHADDFQHVWLDVGDVVQVHPDASDEDDALFLMLSELIDGGSLLEEGT